jgi:dipeptidyl aminopeptidase/acylaminoacyl peptidase
MVLLKCYLMNYIKLNNTGKLSATLIKTSAFSILLWGGLSFSAFAQKSLSYQLPPQSIVELVDAPSSPTVRFNGAGTLMLLLEKPGYASIEEVAQPVIGLAGLRINPLNNSTAAEVSGFFNGISIKDLRTGKIHKLEGLPKQLKMANITWGPDGDYFAFTNNGLNGIELWIADVKNFKVKKLTEEKLNDAFGKTIQWHPDGKHILAQFLLRERGQKPVENLVPEGPVVQENLGIVTPSVTYQNLLKNDYDQRLMAYYLNSQLKSVDLNGKMTAIGEPAIYRNAAYSPDGNYILVQTVVKPYSYLVPIYAFPLKTAILNAAGNLVKELYHAPLAEKLPIGFDAVPTGPRAYEWRSDAGSTLVWAEAQDQGNPQVKTAIRDALFMLKAPFQEMPQKVFSMATRYAGAEWGNANYAVVAERWRKDRTTKLTLINPDQAKVIKVLSTRSSEDAYTDPGDFLKGKGAFPAKVLLFDKANKNVVFTFGAGASPLGDRPFVLKWNLITNKKDTLFKSKAPFYEVPVFFNNTGTLYISRESASATPNIFAINLKNNKEQALTHFTDPYPSLQGVQKTLLSYPRADGVKLSGTLYLPKGYKKQDGPLPVLIWAYPREFKSLAAAGQVKGSPYSFTRLAFRSPVFWVTRGYAVVDQADMPIVGEGQVEPNDTFLKQIEANAEALINHIVNMGVADRNRIGVGGHSYGAFMTANLLAHTKLFAAGIARSGAYNRTLTPFGFQAETRTFWQAPEVYSRMSPFNYADKIKTPLLLTHGIDDENSGTFPMQSERLYSAIKGHGGTVRLVLLPKEFHGYRSRESILHTFWEQDAWLEKYVKQKK